MVALTAVSTTPLPAALLPKSTGGVTTTARCPPLPSIVARPPRAAAARAASPPPESTSADCERRADTAAHRRSCSQSAGRGTTSCGGEAGHVLATPRVRLTGKHLGLPLAATADQELEESVAATNVAVAAAAAAMAAPPAAAAAIATAAPPITRTKPTAPRPGSCPNPAAVPTPPSPRPHTPSLPVAGLTPVVRYCWRR